ncbi:MAG: hypothetical protein V1867_07110 [Candidatus Falkowbacteria bacterium]
MITVEGVKYPWKSGWTISRLLADLKIVASVGLVYLNGQGITRKDFENNIIPDGAIIKLMSIAGG